tara:strand:+ start:1362 stop:2006 length:645 start_codon:yes stop_codon:yes gene_type:complete
MDNFQYANIPKTWYDSHVNISNIKEKYDMVGCICDSPNLEYLRNFKYKMGEDCKVYCEIGVLYGGSMILMMDMEFPCLHIGIDPFTGYYGKSFDPHRNIDLTNHFDIASENINKNNSFFQKWKLIKGNSEDVHEKITEEIDLLFIDGNHTKKGVQLDFLDYKNKIRQGGFIIFDNYDDRNWREVRPAVDEIIECFPEEFKLYDAAHHLCVIQKL